MPKKGHGYVDLRYYSYHTDHYFNSSGTVKKAYNDFTQKTGFCEVQWGIQSNRSITLVTSWGRFLESMNRNRQGWQDLEIGLRQYLITKNDYNISLHTIVIIPMGLRYYSPVRYGSFGFEMELWGYKFFNLLKHLSYFEWKSGYRYYSKTASDQIRINVKFATYLTKKLKFLGKCNAVIGGLNGSFCYNASNIELNPNYRLLNFAAQGEWCINTHFFLYGGGFYHLLGKNIGTGGGWFAGVFMCY